MKQFQELFSDEKIIFYLCRIRAKIANQRNKKHLLHLFTNDNKFNYHVEKALRLEHVKTFEEEVLSLFPSRSKWIKLGNESRYRNVKKSKNHKLTTIDKNIYSLLKTIKKYRKENSQEPFIIRLNDFIKDIQETASNLKYNLTEPIVYPEPKDFKSLNRLKVGEENICRPISYFNLKDRLLLSFTNNFLSKLFDKYFEDSSLAFRFLENGTVNHHTAIQRIMKECKPPIWVAECDMKKFYDSVDHKIIKKQLNFFVKNSIKDNPHLKLEIPIHLFNCYLKCYSFNSNVLSLNPNLDYWEKYKIPKGKYGWIEDEIAFFYKDVANERIGIPQGGALSGLIANMVLDIADKAIKQKFEDAFYVRFCDDMMIFHKDEDICQKAINTYETVLKKCKLAPHSFLEVLSDARTNEFRYLPEHTFKPFWEGKSKGPYKWDSVNTNGFPWIGFVGYEMHYTGAIRVRKKSLKKELTKQKKVIQKIKGAIAVQRRVVNGTITESAIRRLVGMSVSRVDLWNYTVARNELCWKNGFKELNKNNYSIKQMKLLDRNRSKLYYDLIKQLEEDELKIEIKKTKQPRQIIAYNKPFSYFYHVIEKE